MSKKKKKKSVFSACFSCFSTIPIDCNELTCPGYVGNITEFEYIVENMSIMKVPKKFLHEKLENDFSGYVVREIPPETSIGPVVKTDRVSFEVTGSGDLHVNGKPYRPALAAPICMTCQNVYSPLTTETFHAHTDHILDDTMQELLTPISTLKQDQSKKEKVFADIHKPDIEDGISVPIIPPEIKETIDALKVARPLHINSKFSPRNHRSLIRTPSNTSCDKETLCNLSDEQCIEAEKLQKKVDRWYTQAVQVDASSSTSDFQDTTEYNKITSSDLQSSEKVETTESLQGQSLKWKIIINKHKEDVNI